ncbi:hypothetical protein [Gemmatimonas sp.]|uniref:hypothetical protein n=1 Tax=Gemmatimonas sp. TaxID=1962908 RepID=UPI0037BEAB47
MCAARRWYNDAIARGDAEGIQHQFAPGYHAIFGRSSEHIEGDSAARMDWRDEFRTNGTGSCTRIPVTVIGNPAWGLAHERGTWRMPVTFSSR